MGLDMFLVKRINEKLNVPKNGFWFNGFWRKTMNFPLFAFSTPIEIGFDSSKNTEGVGDFEEVLRLRNANAIHGWFVKNVQRGNDDGKVYLVKNMVLEKLKMACLAVIADPIRAPELLPVYRGSSFGSYEYDEAYFESLLAVVDCLDSLEHDEDDVYYDAWH